MQVKRNWTVLLIGGASGMGKSSIAYALAGHYKVNVIEVDDVCQAIKAVTNYETLPSLHYWQTGVDFKTIGVSGNVQWLQSVGMALIPALKRVVENHLETNIPIIIEGDFIHPHLMAAFKDPRVKMVCVYEDDTQQIVENYLSREGGTYQTFRAEISTAYGQWLKDVSEPMGIQSIAPRPWTTSLERFVDLLDEGGLGCSGGDF